MSLFAFLLFLLSSLTSLSPSVLYFILYFVARKIFLKLKFDPVISLPETIQWFFIAFKIKFRFWIRLLRSSTVWIVPSEQGPRSLNGPSTFCFLYKFLWLDSKPSPFLPPTESTSISRLILRVNPLWEPFLSLPGWIHQSFFVLGLHLFKLSLSPPLTV